MSDKIKIKEYLKNEVEKKLKELEDALKAASALATHSEMKQEGKYDTRSIEAGYLAGAQKKRVEELKQELELVDSIPINGPQKVVSLGSLVEIELDKTKRWYYISSTSGGSLVPFADSAALVVSVFSPLGAELLELEVGDEIEVDQGSGARVYKVIEIK